LPENQALGLTLEQMVRMSELLDQAMELDEAGRRRWLARLPPEDQGLAEALHEALFPENRALDSPAAFPQWRISDRPPSGLAAGELIGPYELIRLLGSGGMAEVWLAKRADGAFTREVALKLPTLTRLRKDLALRFTRERDILASLEHPNIARLYDAGIAPDGQPYIALEFVVGAPLTVHCDEHRLTVRERLALFRQVLGAVQYAHANLIIHRDLKPSNILVSETGQVQLLDFGIAKLLSGGEARETELTQLSGRVLTPDYAAPEQITGASITTAADVYALGVMLYEILTGNRPYRLTRTTRGALEEAILGMEPAAPSRAALGGSAAQARATSPKRLAKLLNGDLDAIVLKALKKSPTERYPSASAFDEDIGRFLQGERVLAQLDSIVYRAVKFVRRHRLGMAVTGVLIATLAGGLLATTYEARVASAQRDAAVHAQLRSLAQTAEARLKEFGASYALAIALELLPTAGSDPAYAPEALNVFQEARAEDAQLMAVTGHTDRLRAAAFSPDGQRVVTASFDDTARIWDAHTGRELVRLRGHTDHLIAAAFSVDGRRVITASYDKTARIWDATTGGQLAVLRGHSDRLRSLALSADGRRIVTGSFDKTARVWDAASGRELLQLIGHTDVLAAVAFSPDGRHIVTGSMDKSARIWDGVSGRQILLLAHPDRVISVAYSPDGRRIVTGSADNMAYVWDAVTGAPLQRLIGHSQLVAAASFSPDGDTILTGAYDGTARLWDATTGKPLRTLSGHTDAVESAGFSADGRQIVTGSSDGTFRIWDAEPARLVMRLTGHTDQLPDVAYSGDGTRVISCSFDGTARIWDAASGRELTRLVGHTGRVISAEFSPDGQRAVTASLDKTARIWEAATGRELKLLAGHTDAVFSAAFSPDGQRIVTTSLDDSARVWSVATGRELLKLTGHTAAIWNATYSSDGRRIATASSDKSARIWDGTTGRLLLNLSGHTDVVERVDLSRDGARAVTASDDRTIGIWDAGSGREISAFAGHGDIVVSASFSSDGRRVVTGSADHTARIWDVATGQQLLVIKQPDVVERAAFSPDGTRVVTASDDSIARIWDASVEPVAVQVAWARAAQFNGLSERQRYQLGLLTSATSGRWPDNRSKCDEAAAAPYDPDRRAPGVALDQIDTDVALAACTVGTTRAAQARETYQRGRARSASGNVAGARADFETARDLGYRAAQIDLAMLLARPVTGRSDVTRAISLYRQAWRDGVAIAAFELGALYERGVGPTLARDATQALSWYRRGADAGEPNALAWFGARSLDTAGSAASPRERHAALLESFAYYAAASARAQEENWPEDSWREWRYRRASFARLLAREGMQRQVATTYDQALQKYLPARPTWWSHLTMLLAHK
jgi:WD40 repeat protein/serine/threonine protein kinase